MSEPTAWERVVAATEVHNIDRIEVHLDLEHPGGSWTYVYCACGNQPAREAFREPWEFTDHIRRIVFRVLEPHPKP